MSYVVASTSNPNGFRPWNSRLGDLSQVRRARSLGYLGDAGAPDGTVLSIQVTFRVGWKYLLPDIPGVISAVSSRLSQSGIQLRSYRQLNSIINLQGMSIYSFEFIVQVSTNAGGFGSTEDVYSILANGIYNYTGEMPQTHSIPWVQVPGSSTPTATGQPGAVSGQNPQVPSNTNPDQPGATFTDWLKNSWPFVAAGVGGLLLLKEL